MPLGQPPANLTLGTPRAAGPRRARIECLDVLRGVAVLGIFMVNVQAFAMIPAGYANPTLEADWGPRGQAAWTFVHTFFSGKFVTLFAVMFGAGVLLMSGEGEDERRTALHLRRMKWLFAIGLAHAVLFWYGDILAPYAVGGLLVAGARGWSASRLAAWGLALALLSVGMIFLATWPGFASDPAAARAAWAPTPDAVAEAEALFRRPWTERLGPLADVALSHEIQQLVFYMPAFTGLMMIGMALAKTGFLLGAWPARRYALLAPLALLGALGSGAASRMQVEAGFDLSVSAAAQALQSLASLPQALGYAAVVMLLCKPAALAWARAPFAAVGRTALSCYLGCTVVGWLVFYGPPGFGLIGRVSRSDQIAVALWTWAGMLILAPLWLRVFAFGPAEWVWRSLTYGRRQPWLRRPPGLASHDDIK